MHRSLEGNCGATVRATTFPNLKQHDEKNRISTDVFDFLFQKLCYLLPADEFHACRDYYADPFSSDQPP